MRKLVTIRTVEEIIEIPKADNICQIRVGGWYLIAKKEEFEVNSLCCFFEIDSILPKHDVFEFMAPRKYRVKTIKCMKQVSQGLALPLSILKHFTDKDVNSFKVDDCLDEIIGVVKYDPQAEFENKQRNIRPALSWWRKLLFRIPFFRKLFQYKSKMVFPSWLVQKTDEERVQNLFNHQYKAFCNEDIYVTEKLDGCSATYAYRPNLLKDEFVVCSRNFHLVDNDNSWWWKTANKLSIRMKLQIIHTRMKLKNNEWLIVQGEILNSAIQKNKYAAKDFEYHLFNVMSNNKGIIEKYSYVDMKEIFGSLFDIVPLLDIKIEGDITEKKDFVEYWVKKSQIKSTINPKIHAEGIVIRLVNQNQSKLTSFKTINPKFLLKYDE